MSKATKKKHVTREVLNDFKLPEDNQEIVKVIASRGNNLHEVLTANGDKYLVSMPSKFRKNVWIKRGDYLIVDPIEEGDKVKAEINSILLKHQIKYIQEEGKWPPAFNETNETNNESNNDVNNDQLFRNTNRAHFDVSESSDTTTDSEEDDSDSEEDDSDSDQ